MCGRGGREGGEEEMEVRILIVLLSAGEMGEQKWRQAGYRASVVCDGYFYFAY